MVAILSEDLRLSFAFRRRLFPLFQLLTQFFQTEGRDWQMQLRFGVRWRSFARFVNAIEFFLERSQPCGNVDSRS